MVATLAHTERAVLLIKTVNHLEKNETKTECESEQRRSRERYIRLKIRHMPFSVARRPVAMQEQVAAPPARVGVAGAMQHAQCGINAGSFSAPQPDPRARLKVPPPVKALKKICE